MKVRRLSAVAASALALSIIAAGCSDDSDGGDDNNAGGENPSVEDWTPEWKDGVLQPLPDGFPSEPISIVVADEPSSAEGIQVTQMQEVANEMSPVELKLEARNDFQGLPVWEALNYVNDDELGKEGYKLVAFAPVGAIADIGAGAAEEITGLDLEDVQEVIATEDQKYFVSQCAKVDWEPTMEALVAETQERPGEVRFMAQGDVGGSDLAFFSYMKLLGAGEMDVIPVGDATAKTTAVAACEGDVTISTIETALPHMEKGLTNFLMVSGTERISDYPDLPSAADLGVPNGGIASAKEFIASNEVDPLHVQWLYELFNGISQDEDYLAERDKLPGVVVTVLNPEETDAKNHELQELVFDTLDDLGLLKVER